MLLALEGIRILDLTRLLPGPYCTMFFADFGAEVIKVEEPRLGDYIRWNPPFYQQGASYRHEIINRNKKSIAIDLKSVEGREIFKRLAQKADVVVESFRPGVARKLGIDYQAVREVKEDIIYCSISGYGQDGPYSQIPGHDINYISIAGLLINNGIPAEPIVPGVQVADLGAGGMMAAIGILTALVNRQLHGGGQYIDISMLDGAVSWLLPLAVNIFAGEKAPKRGQHQLTGGRACYQVYKTKDGKFISVGNLEEKFWVKFCIRIGREDLIERANDPPEQQAELRVLLQNIFAAKTRAEWNQELFSEDVCFAPVLEVEEAFEDPQVVHRNMIFEIPHSKGGLIKQIGFPIKLSQTPGKFRLEAPGLGEHSKEILQELGYDHHEIGEMVKKGVVSAKPGD